jgi:tight adherence protein B
MTAGALAAVALLIGTRVPPSARLRRAVPGLPVAQRIPFVRYRRGARIVASFSRPDTGRDDPDVAGLAEQVAALSRAGLPRSRVWQSLAESAGPLQPLCAGVAVHVEAGGTVAEGLRGADGPPSVQWLAVACDVAERAGSPAADVLERFASAVRADTAAIADRDAALAGPRATATVLSWLPLGGVVLGWLIGADPVGTLFGTGAGRACLVTGTALWALGRWWTSALLHRAERAGR